ncbi:MAG: hypothetical protein Kow00108_22240 [Calditrichia bacterium]
MVKIRKIDIGSVALYSFVMTMILIGILFIPVILFILTLSLMVPAEQIDPGLTMFRSFGVVFILIVPIFYAGIITLMNVLLVALYNLLSNKFGGIKIELKEEENTN